MFIFVSIQDTIGTCAETDKRDYRDKEIIEIDVIVEMVIGLELG